MVDKRNDRAGPHAGGPLGRMPAVANNPEPRVTLLCPNLKCRTVLQVSEKLRGKKVRCRQCGTAFLVPPRGGAGAGASAPSSTTSG